MPLQTEVSVPQLKFLYLSRLKFLCLPTGELYVIVEYCHFGNLRSYLLKHKDSFCDTMDENQPPAPDNKPPEMMDGGATYKDPAKPYYVNKAGGPGGSADAVGPPLTTRNLICWAFQVARGMEYLSSKKVRRDGPCPAFVFRMLISAVEERCITSSFCVSDSDFSCRGEMHHVQLLCF